MKKGVNGMSKNRYSEGMKRAEAKGVVSEGSSE
jgi:hypothetical protein